MLLYDDEWRRMNENIFLNEHILRIWEREKLCE